MTIERTEMDEVRLYQMALNVAAELFHDAGYCVRDSGTCRRNSSISCSSCIKRWLIGKAATELKEVTNQCVAE